METTEEHVPKLLEVNQVHCGDARSLLPRIAKNSVACSVWSPPYFVGKQYEAYLKSYESWASLIREILDLHFRILSEVCEVCTLATCWVISAFESTKSA